MQNNVQAKFLEIGRNGCYFLCLLKIAELTLGKPLSVIDAYEKFLEKGYIKRNCFVLQPKNILSDLCNKYVAYQWKEPNYRPLPGEFIVKRYAMKIEKGELTHFVLFDENDTEIFNPAMESPAYRGGKVADLRVFEVGR